jgi:hypothetical protein
VKQDDGEQLARSLADHLAALTFTDLDADQVTELLVEAVIGWASAAGWRAYKKARSVMPLPPPYADRHSWVDVGIARADALPVVVEIDQSDRKRTLEKLRAEADAGRIALWVRWGKGPFNPPELPVRLASCLVDVRKDAAGRKLFSSHVADRPPPPAPAGIELAEVEQVSLFGTPNPE